MVARERPERLGLGRLVRVQFFPVQFLPGPFLPARFLLDRLPPGRRPWVSRRPLRAPPPGNRPSFFSRRPSPSSFPNTPPIPPSAHPAKPFGSRSPCPRRVRPVPFVSESSGETDRSSPWNVCEIWGFGRRQEPARASRPRSGLERLRGLGLRVRVRERRRAPGHRASGFARRGSTQETHAGGGARGRCSASTAAPPRAEPSGQRSSPRNSGAFARVRAARPASGPRRRFRLDLRPAVWEIRPPPRASSGPSELGH